MRNEPAFHDLERMMAPTVEVVRGQDNNPSSQIIVPVDWPVVLKRADELRKRGRDLRLLVLTTRALANENGFAGLAEGLDLIARTIADYWETMHPGLRAGAPPAEAALRRINALMQLQNDEDGVLADLRKRVFLSPRGIGQITGRELERALLDERTVLNEAAAGLGAAERQALASAHQQLIAKVRTGSAAMADQAAGELAALTTDARAAMEALAAVDAALGDGLGTERQAAPELRQFLQRVLATLQRATTAQANGALHEPADASAEASAPQPAAFNGTASAPAMEASPMASNTALPERIASRDDVVKCLDLVVAFYDRTEPSSPIPHLARRVRRMVHMDFVELMEDLAPSGLKEFRMLAGMPDGKKMPQKDER